MKNNIVKMKKLLGLILILSVFFTACTGSGGGIYSTIEREVKLNNRSIVNIVYRMTQFGSNLYACNGSLFTKGASSGPGWTHVPVEGAPGTIVSVAADSTYIYILVVTSSTDSSSTGTVFASTDGIRYITTGHTGIWTTDGAGCVLFDNKAKDNANRKAYFNSGNNTVLLNGISISTTSVGNVKGAATQNGTTVFHSSEAITSNLEETQIWKSSDLTVNDSKNPSTNLWGDNVKSLTYFANSSSTYLLAGFDANHYNGGYTPFNLVTGHPDTSVTTPNAGGFSGSDIIFMRNINGVLYMSVYTQPAERCGLWSYYPGDPNWNLE